MEVAIGCQHLDGAKGCQRLDGAKQGWRHEFEVGGAQCIGRWGGVNTVKTLIFEKGGGCRTR